MLLLSQFAFSFDAEEDVIHALLASFSVESGVPSPISNERLMSQQETDGSHSISQMEEQVCWS
jgi:uncharacterized membrane-anchored protein